MAHLGIHPPFLQQLQVGPIGNVSYNTLRCDCIKYFKGPRHVNLRSIYFQNQSSLLAIKTCRGLGVVVVEVMMVVVEVTLLGGQPVQLLRPCSDLVSLRRTLPEASCCVDCGSAGEVQHLQPSHSPLGGLLSWQDAARFLPRHCILRQPFRARCSVCLGGVAHLAPSPCCTSYTSA